LLLDRIANAWLAVTRKHSNWLAVLGGRSIEFSVDIIGDHDDDLINISIGVVMINIVVFV